jgi:N-acetylglucosaminyldiphosphoundecaprenol N-acetyl-beta-D-mannosaminyltransferase
MKTVNILGTRVAAATRQQATDQVLLWARASDRAYAVGAADVHVIARARHQPDYGACISRFDLVLPDGMPLVWNINAEVADAERLHERVSGAELMRGVFRATNDLGQPSHFLLGGSEKLLADLQQTLKEQYPRAVIAGAYSPPFGVWPDDEWERMRSKIAESNAAFVWVGLGCPKQEKWIGEHLSQLPSAVYFAVGAAFGFIAGHVDRAPEFFQKNGLEWFYRICKEPHRLWKRYFVYNSLFVGYWLRDRMKAK